VSTTKCDAARRQHCLECFFHRLLGVKAQDGVGYVGQSLQNAEHFGIFACCVEQHGGDRFSHIRPCLREAPSKVPYRRFGTLGSRSYPYYMAHTDWREARSRHCNWHAASNWVVRRAADCAGRLLGTDRGMTEWSSPGGAAVRTATLPACRTAGRGRVEPRRGQSWPPETGHPRGASQGNSEQIAIGRSWPILAALLTNPTRSRVSAPPTS